MRCRRPRSLTVIIVSATACVGDVNVVSALLDVIAATGTPVLVLGVEKSNAHCLSHSSYVRQCRPYGFRNVVEVDNESSRSVIIAHMSCRDITSTEESAPSKPSFPGQPGQKFIDRNVATTVLLADVDITTAALL